MSPQGILFVVLGIFVAVLLPRPATATEHWVGDANGWRPGFDYTTWTMGRQFRVGDSLVFRYVRGMHNVYKVSGPEFRDCTVPANSTALDSGIDVVRLMTEGRKWYICGVGDHCERGQKLVITVLPAPQPPQMPPVPAPAGALLPPSPAYGRCRRCWPPVRY